MWTIAFYLCTNIVQSPDFVQSSPFRLITKWQSIFSTSPVCLLRRTV